MKKTALYEKLLSLGGRFVEFGGFLMPVQFQGGILSEHRAVRNAVGIFDVSHMGEFVLEGENAERDLNYLFTNDFSGMPEYKVKYTLMCDESGGVVDDLLVYKVSREKFYIVVNASNIDKDREFIQKNLKFGSVLKDLSDETSMIAVQGPLAEGLTKRIFKDLPKSFYSFIFSEFKGAKTVVSRTGYTGEDGFEIYCENRFINDLLDEFLALSTRYNPAFSACKNSKLSDGSNLKNSNGSNEASCDKISENYGVSNTPTACENSALFNIELAGLGARDTLRLESSMPLYGHEMNGGTLATELGLNAYIKLGKDGFIGKDALLKNPPKYRRVGLKIIDRGIARERCAVFCGGEPIGEVTSGTMSPTLGFPVAMARIEIDAGDDLTVDVRGKRLKAEIIEMPFYKK
jgi:aminomethyltransferase